MLVHMQICNRSQKLQSGTLFLLQDEIRRHINVLGTRAASSPKHAHSLQHVLSSI